MTSVGAGRGWLPHDLHAEPLIPPPMTAAWGEAMTLRELPRLVLRTPRLLRAPRGAEPVLVLPGFGSSDRSTWPLRTYLGWLGHDARGWGLGRNHGDVGPLLMAVESLLGRRADEAGSAVTVIGWSLGGVLAREVARDRPELVRQVVTYGTPVVGGPRYTLSAAAYGPAKVAEMARMAAERAASAAIRVPVTAIYSRRDRVVAWRACVDTGSPRVHHVEVRSTHAGLGIDPDVWQVVAERLAAG